MRVQDDRVAHASEILERASRDCGPPFWLADPYGGIKAKDCFLATPKPARETRGLSGKSYSPKRRRNCARPYSRLSFEMKLALISAGHTASHS